jgi:hypothetical protein
MNTVQEMHLTPVEPCFDARYQQRELGVTNHSFDSYDSYDNVTSGPHHADQHDALAWW